MRARLPDATGHLEREGVTLGYEVFGASEPTILLLPTWTIVHSRFWKMQVPYLARHFRVITFDGPGNGRSDRTTDPVRYSPDAYARDGYAVLEACSVDKAVVIGLSLGAQCAIRMATLHPDRVLGVVLVGPTLDVEPPLPERAAIAKSFYLPYPADPQGWEKYNLAYWRDQYEDFARFFFSQVFPESHSTKPIEDAVGWALETGVDVLAADRARPDPEVSTVEVLAHVRCPVLVIHGTDDRISSHRTGATTARLCGGTLMSLEGSGHMPNVRDPVKVNLAIRSFVERLAS